MAKSKGNPKTTLHIITDGTGNLADHILNAVLTQFPGHEVEKKFHFIHSPQEAEQLKKSITSKRVLCFHAVVSPAIKSVIDSICDRKKIPHFDLTGSLVQFMADHLHQAPINERSSLHNTDAGYFKRIRAMEFTAQHDDARRIATARNADIIILGLSRVSKSPTSTFLGSLGYKVANIAIARETGIPKEILKIRQKKVVALTMQPKRLFEIRSARFKEFDAQIDALQAVARLPYTNLREVISEVVWAESQYRQHGYPIIDTTTQTIEETSAAILAVLKPGGPRFKG